MAVFKVISVPQKYADEDAYADLIHYCIRPMKTPGNFIDGFGVLPQLAAEQMQIVSHAYRQDHGIRLRHWIISFEKGEIRHLCLSGKGYPGIEIMVIAQTPPILN